MSIREFYANYQLFNALCPSNFISKNNDVRDIMELRSPNNCVPSYKHLLPTTSKPSDYKIIHHDVPSNELIPLLVDRRQRASPNRRGQCQQLPSQPSLEETQNESAIAGHHVYENKLQREKRFSMGNGYWCAWFYN
jgi:hypothetical protein